MKFTILNKTGYKGRGRVEIYDSKKRPFYTFFFNPFGFFNLPKGTYYTKSDISKVYKPIEFEYYELPKREKNRMMPRKIVVKYGSNPEHKGTVIMTKDIYYINLDKKYKNIGRPAKCFIKYHELGHHLYKTEEKADHFAYRLMILRGFNPSQIYEAAKRTLDSDISKERIKKMYLLTTKKYNNHGL